VGEWGARRKHGGTHSRVAPSFVPPPTRWGEGGLPEALPCSTRRSFRLLTGLDCDQHLSRYASTGVIVRTEGKVPRAPFLRAQDTVENGAIVLPYGGETKWSTNCGRSVTRVWPTRPRTERVGFHLERREGAV